MSAGQGHLKAEQKGLRSRGNHSEEQPELLLMAAPAAISLHVTAAKTHSSPPHPVPTQPQTPQRCFLTPEVADPSP